MISKKVNHTSNAKSVLTRCSNAVEMPLHYEDCRLLWIWADL